MCVSRHFIILLRALSLSLSVLGIFLRTRGELAIYVETRRSRIICIARGEVSARTVCTVREKQWKDELLRARRRVLTFLLRIARREIISVVGEYIYAVLKNVYSS